MMSPSPDPPFESQPQGISLDELAEAFAQVMGAEPRRIEETPLPDAEPLTALATARSRRSRKRLEQPPMPPHPPRRPRRIPAPSIRGPFWKRCSSWATARTSRSRRPGRPS